MTLSLEWDCVFSCIYKVINAIIKEEFGIAENIKKKKNDIIARSNPKI